MKHTWILLSISFIFLYNSNPFIFGILISINARPYRSGLKLDNANKGSLYELTSNPFICKIMSKVEVISGSSSTIRIFLDLLEPLLLLSAAAIPRKKHPIDIGASVLYIIIMMLLLMIYSSSFSFVFFFRSEEHTS